MTADHRRETHSRAERAPVRVLVVDDTDHVRSMLVNMLNLDGFDVVGEAVDGHDAVRVAEEADPHVVVMDLRMPHLDGIEATRQIKARRPHQVVLIYSAYLDESVDQRAGAAGARRCLPKLDGLVELERELALIELELGAA